MPKISVIVPCYNQAQYLDECLDSVLSQSFEDWECIIINDDSTDNTIDIAKNWVHLDKRFKIISIANAGVSKARNVGIDNSNSDLILPLDADDKIAPLYLEKAFEEYQTGNYTIVYCKAKYFGKKEGVMPVKFKSIKNLLLKNEIFVTALFNKEDYKLIGGYDINMNKGFEDWEFWINLLSHTNGKVKQLDYFGFFYRIKNVSRNQQVMENKLSNDLMTFHIYKKHSKNYFKYYGSPLYYIRVLNEINSKLDILQTTDDINYIVKMYTIRQIFKMFVNKILKKLKNAI